MIEIITHTHASELISLSGAYLEQNESENNLPLGFAYRLAEAPPYHGSEPPLLLSILDQGKPVGVAIMIPEWRMLLSRIGTEVQSAIVHLARHLREIDVRIPEVLGPTAEAQTFSDCWVEEMLGVSSKIAMRIRLFEARAVADLPLSPGKLRLACMEDHPLMARWHFAYWEETFDKPVNFEFAKGNNRLCACWGCVGI